MTLAELLRGQAFRLVSGTDATTVSSLVHDSRRVKSGSAFFCLPGKHFDGHDFAAEAVARGARAVVAERSLSSLPAGTPCALVADARLAFALAAARLWGHPSSHLRLVAVTGTNGKTTVNHLNEAIFLADGRPTGLIGTVENHLGLARFPADLTTPDAQDIQAGLTAMRRAGLTCACLEVSSHGLAGRRIAGCEVDVAILTNVARDHLEFHGDVRAYAATKLSLFRGLGQRSGRKPGPVYAILNADDAFFDSFRRRLPAPVLTYGALRPAHVKLLWAGLGAKGSLVRMAFDFRPRGLPEATWLRPAAGWPETASVRFPHPGRHNVWNLLASLAVAWAEGCRWEAAREAVERFPGVRGRWEVVASPDGVTGVVDFAHNPRGLAGALETARLATRRRVILVFGCEGQKDRGKRPAMGEIAARLADHVILTTDNTFFEDGRQIREDIKRGLVGPDGGERGPDGGERGPAEQRSYRATYEIIEDRREAIFRAAAIARSGDLVVVAGRGHDARLVFGSRVETLDDREVLEEALRQAQAAYSHSMVEGGLEVTS